MEKINLTGVSGWFQYNGTYFTTYKESGTRRLTLAERLRKLPLSFFGKRDLADLTSTIMADCEVLEKNCSHFIPGLFGSLISTVLIALGLFLFDWRMALAALWVIPVSAAIVLCSYRVQDRVQSRTMAVKMTCADGIQEYIESIRDLMAGGAAGRTAFYVCGCVACFALILLTTWFQYNGTYFTTYQESGIRRLTLAERLRRLPLSFFGKRDLADLTSTIMADCEVLE